MSKLRVCTTVLVLGLLVPACDKAPESVKTEAEPAADPIVAPPKDPKQLFATKRPELPGPLAELRFGMSAAEVSEAVPELKTGHMTSTGYAGVRFGLGELETGKTLENIYVVIEGADAEKILTAAWGEPKRGTAYGQPQPLWFNADKGIRVRITRDMQDQTIHFERYLPVAMLLGPGKQTLGFETTPLLGASVEDLKRAYGQYLQVLTAEEAARQREREEVEALAGQALNADGRAAEDTNLDLPPTEYAMASTRVHPTIAEGKIVRFRVAIDYGQMPAARDEIFALLKAKWGEPVARKDPERKLWVLHAAVPEVVVEDDDVGESWNLEISR